MKKVIVALMALVALVSADGIVAGVELGYGKVNSDLTVTPGGSISQDTKTLAVTVKGGVQVDELKLMGYLTSEKYSDDMVVFNEGNLISYGLEANYALTKEVFVGLSIGQGYKDFDGIDIDFKDIAIKGGMTVDMFEVGLQLKKRTYDSYNLSGFQLDMDDTIVGVFVGLSFNL